MTAIGAQEMIEARRQHLTALSTELQTRGLGCRLLGPDESVLRVTSTATGRRLMVLASPTTDGWSFLWSGGGMADATNPANAAQQITQAINLT